MAANPLPHTLVVVRHTANMEYWRACMRMWLPTRARTAVTVTLASRPTTKVAPDRVVFDAADEYTEREMRAARRWDACAHVLVLAREQTSHLAALVDVPTMEDAAAFTISVPNSRCLHVTATPPQRLPLHVPGSVEQLLQLAPRACRAKLVQNPGALTADVFDVVLPALTTAPRARAAKCVVCLQEPAPFAAQCSSCCGCVCALCARELQPQRCPLCRTSPLSLEMHVEAREHPDFEAHSSRPRERKLVRGADRMAELQHWARTEKIRTALAAGHDRAVCVVSKHLFMLLHLYEALVPSAYTPGERNTGVVVLHRAQVKPGVYCTLPQDGLVLLTDPCDDEHELEEIMAFAAQREVRAIYHDAEVDSA